MSASCVTGKTKLESMKAGCLFCTELVYKTGENYLMVKSPGGCKLELMKAGCRLLTRLVKLEGTSYAENYLVVVNWN